MGVQKQLGKLQEKLHQWEINRKHKAARRERKRLWLEWANLMANNPDLLEVVSREIIKPGKMASDLVKSFAKKDKAGINAWIQQMEIGFFKLLAEKKIISQSNFNKDTYGKWTSI